MRCFKFECKTPVARRLCGSLEIVLVLILGLAICDQSAAQNGLDPTPQYCQNIFELHVNNEVIEENTIKERPITRESEEIGEYLEYDVAVMRGLDKITARVTTIVLPLDEPIVFGSLCIRARFCGKTRPEERPETAIFLEILDSKQSGEVEGAFTGWMFASSPALSALEHPVYDVWAIDCKMSVPDQVLGRE